MAPIQSIIRKAHAHTDQATMDSVSIVQLARKRTLMRSIEQAEFKLQAPPSSKMHIRDAPRMECASLKKMYNRSALAESVRGAIKLRVLSANEISDRSAPVIEAGVRIRFSERRAFLHALLLQVEQFYIRVLSTVSHIHHTSIETAQYVRANAPGKVHDMYEAGKETALLGQQKASSLIDSSKGAFSTIKVNAQGIASDVALEAREIAAEARDIAREARINATELIEVSANAVGLAAKTAAKAVAAQANIIAVKGKSLFSAEHEEILLHKRPIRIRTRALSSEAAIYEAYGQLLIEVAQNRQNLNHVLLSEIKDRSKPFILSSEARNAQMTKHTLAARNQVLNEIKRNATCMTLNHVSIRDASCPAVPSTVKNLQNDCRKKLVSEIAQVSSSDLLKAAPVVSDRSAPVLPVGESIKLNKYDNVKKSLLQELEAGVDLSHNSPSLIKDRSAPMVSIVAPGLGSM